MANAVIGLIKSEDHATRVVSDLKTVGFSGSDISVLLPDKTGTRDFAHQANTKMPEGAAAGVGAGGALGGALGWLTGIGSLAIPGLGPFIAAGPIMAALSGAAIGAAVGGVTGALIGMGIPEFEAKQFEGKLREGNILIAVHTDDSEERERARAILEAHDAESIRATGEANVPGARRPTTPSLTG